MGEEELTSRTRTVLSSITEEKESHGSEYGTLNESVTLEESIAPNLSPKERLLMDNIIHVGHWLTETERDASLTVDLADSECIRNAVVQMQVYYSFFLCAVTRYLLLISRDVLLFMFAKHMNKRFPDQGRNYELL